MKESRPSKKDFPEGYRPKDRMDSMTEEQAINAIKRLARRWPKTLCVVHVGSGGSDLRILKGPRGLDVDRLSELTTVAVIRGLNGGSCA